MNFRYAFTGFALAAAASAVVACSGGTSSGTPPLDSAGTGIGPSSVFATAVPSSAPSAAPSMVPSPDSTSTPSPVVLNLASLAFTVAGASLSFSASEMGYSGPLTASSANCAGIVTFSPQSGTGPSATFMVNSLAAGQCQITVQDASAQKAVLQVTVTTTSGTIQ